jgi:hypothetical protein
MKKMISNPESPIRLVKTATCPSLSEKSTLTYNVGRSTEGDIQFRVYDNTGTGFFSKEWVSLKAIQQALAKAADDKSITSLLLHPIYRGRSKNSPGFLLAAIKAEGLVRASTKKRRCYEAVDDSVFLAEVQAWMASGEGPKVERKPTRGKGKAAKAIGEVPPTATTKDVPVKVEVATPLAVMADIVPTIEPEKPKVLSDRPSKKKAN